MDETLILSSSVSPSNRGAGFPNLARRENPPDDVIDEVTAICKAELEVAGIEPHVFGGYYRRGEVPSKCIGGLAGWTFERAWYYWTAKGPGLPLEYADPLHASHGKVVRVDGHCGCPSPREWLKGFAVGSYHIDTPDGLKALANTLKSVAPNTPQPPTSPVDAGEELR